jgi:hypothetical protein
MLALLELDTAIHGPRAGRAKDTRRAVRSILQAGGALQGGRPVRL